LALWKYPGHRIAYQDKIESVYNRTWDDSLRAHVILMIVKKGTVQIAVRTLPSRLAANQPEHDVRGPPMTAATRLATPNRDVAGHMIQSFVSIGPTQEKQQIFLWTLAAEMVADKDI